jgi:membrane associated rhomboid family serine protease
MIEINCDCGTPLRAPEAEANLAIGCPKCRKSIRPVSAEQLPDGAGAADFDTRLVVTEGPAHVGEQLVLGGCMEIELGKQPERHIPLAGKMVSRNHCKLVRLDFGPSRWKLIDNKSTNGCFINGARAYEQELRDGDEITVGDYTLKFLSDAARPAPAPVKAIPVGGPVCPSCSQPLPVNTKICVECGIYIDTGKPLVTAKGFDEDDLAVRADTWIRIVSWIIPFGLFPVASEAFGTRRPVTTWVIAIATVIVSCMFFAVMISSDEPSAGALNLMLWSGDREGMIADARETQAILERERIAAEKARRQQPPAGRPMTRSEQQREFERMMAEAEREMEEMEAADEEAGMSPDDALALAEGGVDFKWYQFLTHALLHDGPMHLAGNLLFLLVFGMRVNELIGNLKMSIVYPLLAIAGGAAHFISTRQEDFHPCLGASGAIMGLAGMYFVLFPVHKVHMAIWFRGGMLTGWRCFYKVFTMGGFWLLLLWIGFNDVLPTLLGASDGVSHWAHLGGFLVGMGIALTLLLTRMTNARGGDLLSVTLGKHAWALVGKPTTRKDPPPAPPAPRAVSLNYGG